jgi:CubicO group peptidase (beta-lactamase class C family)
MRGRTKVSLLTGLAIATVALGVIVGRGRDGWRVRDPGVRAAADSVRRWVEEGLIPGAVLSVWRGGVPVFEGAWGAAQAYAYGGGQYPAADAVTRRDPGIAALDDPVPMTVETVFDLASVTKVMATTMAVALLVDRDLVDPDAPVRHYLPDFDDGGREAITVRHLLTHRSGLPQWLPVYYRAEGRDAAYEYVRSVPLDWEVGSGRHYSDLGFMVLGRLVEVVAGVTLDAFLDAELYGPLGLERTGFRGSAERPADTGNETVFAATSHGNPFERRMVYDADFGYRIEGDPKAWDGWRSYTLVGEVNDGNAHHAFEGIAGHAGLFSTATELQHLLGVILGRGEIDGRRFLRTETVDGFLTAEGDGQALGWQIPDYAPASAFAHTGFTGTFVLGVVETGLGLVLLTNRQNVGVDGETQYPDVGPLQRTVARLVTGTPIPR